MRHNDIWFKDASLGKVSLGKGNMASNGTSEVDLSGTTVIMYSGAVDVGDNFYFRDKEAVATDAVKLGSVFSNLDGASRRNRIRYDTPSLGGFTFSTSASADDVIDGAIRFKKEWSNLRCAAALGIVHDTDGELSTDDWIYSSSGSCLHTASGLNLTGAYSTKDAGDRTFDDQEFWFIKLGLSRRWNSHGKTSIAVQYANNENTALDSDETDSWGIALVQNIDAAALQLYVSYMHHEYDNGVADGVKFNDLDFVTMGARIKF